MPNPSHDEVAASKCRELCSVLASKRLGSMSHKGQVSVIHGEIVVLRLGAEDVLHQISRNYRMRCASGLTAGEATGRTATCSRWFLSGTARGAPLKNEGVAGWLYRQAALQLQRVHIRARCPPQF